MTNTFKEHLEALLKKDERLVDEQGELMGNKIKDLTDKLDETFIGNLLEDEQTRKNFFLQIKEVYVFKAKEFKFFLEQNKLDNSFTNYANRIGLSFGGKYLKDNTDVVLDFPFKDCILEGGQSTEEGLDTYYEYDAEVSKTDAKKGYKAGEYNEKQSKRKEIFFNEVIARDEIDRLLEPKAFTKITKYDAKGESKPTQFNRDVKLNKKRGLPEDTITDNLIIKGNNLLALHSLKEEFKGKVKLIYIDPPYNTGNDEFKYNDNFNRSTWLTFMRNRLQEGKDLLKDDGVIYVHCDDNEQAYLKVVMDEVFGVKNFVNTIVMKTINPNGIKTTHATKTILKVKEQILVYKKSKIKFKPQYKSIDKYDKYYDLFIEGDLKSLKDCKVVKLKDKVKQMGYSFDLNDSRFKDFVLKNSEKIFQTKFDKRVQNDANYSDGGLYLYQENPNYYVYQKRFGLKLSKVVKEVFGKKEIGILLGDVWDDFKLNNLYLEGNVDFSNAKKPEHLMYRIIDMSTNEKDIVLDYHIGSGTTGAVAQKMNRQYIGIEQMDYIDTITVERLNSVIKGEQGGVSKDLNWSGGGSFFKLELAKNNQKAKEDIQECKSYKELLSYFDELYTKYFLHYNVRIKEFKEVISKEENFKKLPLVKQQEIFCRMLDNNQLYVNASEIEDARYNISKEDIALTKNFYQTT